MEIESNDKPDVDEVIREANKAREANEKLRVRLQPSIYNKEKASHVMLPGVFWTVVCESVDEVKGVRKALEAFFEALGRLGPAGVVEALKAQ